MFIASNSISNALNIYGCDPSMPVMLRTLTCYVAMTDVPSLGFDLETGEKCDNGYNLLQTHPDSEA